MIPQLNASKTDYYGPFNSLDELLRSLKSNIDNINNTNYIEENHEIVVFSPGATSFGMFTNEFDRGNKFMAGVKSYF